MDYKILSDMSIDIDLAAAERDGIEFIPMPYDLGEQHIKCEKPQNDAECHNFYEALRNKVKTQTSQVTPFEYFGIFREYVKAGTPLLVLCLSSGLSTTYQSALSAVQDLKEQYDNVQIEVVDTLGATGGVGILAECAAENRRQGMSLAENAAWLREHAGHISYWFKVQDLFYLLRGGRVSAAAAVFGSALQIKPILCINAEGGLDTIAKARGNKQAAAELLRRFEETYYPSEPKLAYICHADVPEQAEELRAQIQEKHPELTIRVTGLCPVIGSHTGPDMMAIIHFATRRK